MAESTYQNDVNSGFMLTAMALVFIVLTALSSRNFPQYEDLKYTSGTFGKSKLLISRSGTKSSETLSFTLRNSRLIFLVNTNAGDLREIEKGLKSATKSIQVRYKDAALGKPHGLVFDIASGADKIRSYSEIKDGYQFDDMWGRYASIVLITLSLYFFLRKPIKIRYLNYKAQQS